MKQREDENPKADLQRFICGFVMGAADVVPGVSGGTMALILGIYERLVGAISRVDGRFLHHLKNRDIKAAARYIEFRFLAALGCGILVGAGGLASVLNRLMLDYRSITFAAFTGMILASSLLVARMVRQWNVMRVGLTFLAALFAFWLVNLESLKNPPDTFWYLFLCGMIGISGMILPGISGAFILLLLSRYETVMSAIRSLVRAEVTTEVILTIAVFGCGCLCGLLAFSRVLRRLLTYYHDTTICIMCGFILGSLYRLWPFQNDLTPNVSDFKHKILKPYLPGTLTPQVWSAIFAAVIAAGGVFALDALARSRSIPPTESK